MLWVLQFESDFDPEPVGFDRRGWLVHVLELVISMTRRFPATSASDQQIVQLPAV